MKKGILFDLDGTLWDSSQEVAFSWQEALSKKAGVEKSITTEDIQRVMGKPMDVIADILFGEFDSKTRVELLEYCCEEENKYIEKHGGKLLADLEETLKLLKAAGNYLYIVSNCQVGYIEAFLSHHKLGHYFADFESFGATKRPKGENIRLVAERNHLDKAVYVGDTQGDYEAATQAEMPFIHARTGYGSVEAEVPYITALKELPKIAGQMLSN